MGKYSPKNMKDKKNNDKKVERRFARVPLEVRQAGEDGEDSRAIRGYAAVFNADNSQLDQEGRGFTERLDPHCFDGVIARSDVCALYEHDYAPGILARSTNGKGTLRLTVDEKGLLCEFDAPHTSLGDDILESVRRGDIKGMSFAFTVNTDEWSRDDKGGYTRTVKQVGQLFDVSLVAMPAYDKTSVSLRAIAMGDEAREPKPGPTPCAEYYQRKRGEIYG